MFVKINNKNKHEYSKKIYKIYKNAVPKCSKPPFRGLNR